MLNAEMIQFCTDQFGNEGWLQLFSLKNLRQRQTVAKQEYVGDQIGSENPYLKAMGSALASKVQDLRDVYNRKSVKLATGYEELIANKEGNLETAKEVDSNLEETQYFKDGRKEEGPGSGQMQRKSLMLNSNSSKSLLEANANR